MTLSSRARAFAGAAVFMMTAVTPAFADATAFIGANTTPANRAARGIAVGIGLLIVGFEFEYAVTSDDPSAGAPSLKTGSTNVLLQTPFEIHGFQPYLTGGIGLYNETLGTQGHTAFDLNTGGGVKVALAGPLRLRVDYRVFKLGSGALYSPAHRFYVGLNLKF
jgi:hypothetical protein